MRSSAWQRQVNGQPKLGQSERAGLRRQAGVKGGRAQARGCGEDIADTEGGGGEGTDLVLEPSGFEGAGALLMGSQ